VSGYKARKEALLADPTITGTALGEALTELTEKWMVELLAAAVDDASGVALAGVGGLGRGLLAPAGDVDVVLLHADRSDAAALAERVWYPIWDEGVPLGHSVRTVSEALALAGDDLHTATSLLDVRHMAGDPSLTDALATGAAEQWQRRSKRWLGELRADVEARRQQFGEVAFLLEPDLKEGRGGLRDIHALWWADRAAPIIDPDDAMRLRLAHDTLADVRMELQRRTRRATSELLLDEQDAIADALSFDDADALMLAVASSARQVTVLSDDTWSLIGRRERRWLRSRKPSRQNLSSGVWLDDDRIQITADPATDPTLLLHVAVTAAEREVLIDRASLRRFRVRQPQLPSPWPEGTRELLVRLLAQGPAAIPVIEALDVYDAWVRVLPEWEPNRSRPQRNAYHRFTVDRHLLEATAQAARLTHRVKRPDLLLVGTLLHDIGKGYPGDHTVVGMELVDTIARRMGFPDEDVAQLVALVQHHLLLPDVATRRDLDDEATVRAVADQLPSADFAELLSALTEADSLATGPAAWGSWKAELVATLTERVVHLLNGGEFSTVPRRSFPTAEHFELMAGDEEVVRGEGQVLTVVTDDVPGQFSRVAGVLAMRGLAVLQADAYSSAAGRALSVFRVTRDDGDPPDWPACEADVHRSLAGRLAIEPRIEERARQYRPRRARAAIPAVTEVGFDNDTSPEATIIEVRTAERPGVLYRITKVLADLGCDLRTVKAQTLNHEVVDAFYVTDRRGEPLSADHQAEVDLAIRHALSTPLPG
jgi:[protein-PII] uridylyltransferase